MHTKQLRTIAAAALAALALVAVAAPAHAMRPDEGAATAAMFHQDLRMPDTQDAAYRALGWHEQAPASAPSARADGFDWLVAAIGAAAAVGLTLVVTGGALAVSRRRATPVA